MKNILFTTIILIGLVSCSTLQYQDPNYLTTSEIAENDKSRTDHLNEITKSNEEIEQNIDNDSSNITNGNNIDYYDYSYSSRIRRFHHPMLYNNYYGSIYTDYYWYSHDPFYFGSNIYLSYNWHDPYYYGNHYYNPYYYGNYYTPYYYGGYYSYYGYGNNLIGNYPTYNYYNNISNYTIGHRGSLSTTKRSVKKRNISNLSNLNTNFDKIKNNNLKDKIRIPKGKKDFKPKNNEQKYYNSKSNNKSYSPKRNTSKNYNSGNRNSSNNNSKRRSVKPR